MGFWKSWTNVNRRFERQALRPAMKRRSLTNGITDRCSHCFKQEANISNTFQISGSSPFSAIARWVVDATWPKDLATSMGMNQGGYMAWTMLLHPTTLFLRSPELSTGRNSTAWDIWEEFTLKNLMIFEKDSRISREFEVMPDAIFSLCFYWNVPFAWYFKVQRHS